MKHPNLTLFLALFTLLPNFGATAALVEDFRETTADPLYWTVQMPKQTSEAVYVNDGLKITAATGLFSKIDFQFPYEVTGSFIANSANDHFKVSLRTDSSYVGETSERKGVAVNFNFPESKIIIQEHIENSPFINYKEVIYLDLQPEVLYGFRIIDTGSELKIYLGGELVLTSDITYSPGNKVGFYNRDFDNSISTIQHFSISERITRIFEHFSSQELDNSVWDVQLPNPQSNVSLNNGSLISKSGGGIITKETFGFENTIRTQFTPLNSGEYFKVLLRSNGEFSESYVNRYGILVSFNLPESKVSIQEIIPESPFILYRGETNFPLAEGQTYAVTIYDDGSSVSVSIAGEELIKQFTDYSPGGRIGFYSREFENTSTRVDYFTVNESGWGMFPIENSRYVDTGSWLGILDISTDPWAYSFDFSRYIYIPEQTASQGKGWTYIP